MENHRLCEKYIPKHYSPRNFYIIYLLVFFCASSLHVHTVRFQPQGITLFILQIAEIK